MKKKRDSENAIAMQERQKQKAQEWLQKGQKLKQKKTRNDKEVNISVFLKLICQNLLER